jgi:hypothetical protein
MLKAIFNWFSHKNPSPESQTPAVQPEAAPYKVEVLEPTKPVTEAAPVTATATAVKKPAAKKPAAKVTAAKKPAAKKTPKKSS